MSTEEIRTQYIEYCKRMRRKGAEFAIIPFRIFKKAMESTEAKGEKDV